MKIDNLPDNNEDNLQELGELFDNEDNLQELGELSEINNYAVSEYKDLDSTIDTNNKNSHSVNSAEYSTVLEEFLMTQPKNIQRQVRKTIKIFNISPKDPYFLILLQCKITQILYESTPGEIEEAFKIGIFNIQDALAAYKKDLFDDLNKHTDIKLRNSFANISNTFDQYFNDFVSKIESNNPRSVEQNKNKLNSKAETNDKYISKKTLYRSLLINLSILITGITVGGLYFSAQNQLFKSWRQQIDYQDQQLLAWAKSNDGKLAKNIIDWNEDLPDKSCENKVKDLGISFQIGSLKMTSGFCVLFVEPVSQRSYR